MPRRRPRMRLIPTPLRHRRGGGGNPVEIRHLVIAPVAVLDRPAMRALAYAASLGQPVVALHVSPSEGEAERFRCYWHAWGDHLPLEVVVSPYRVIVGPLVTTSPRCTSSGRISR